jgi:uncharacterized OsmC-like protein
MTERSVLSKKSTTEVRDRVRKTLESKPELVSTWRVEAEIIEDHLMKAKVSLPELNVSFTIFADEPTSIGGHGSAMMPFGYFMAGAMLCELAQYTWNAAELGVADKIQKISAKLEGGFPLQPLYGMDDRPGAAAIKQMTVSTRIESDASPEEIAQLARLAALRCPAHQSLVNGVPYTNSVELNGEKIAEF